MKPRLVKQGLVALTAVITVMYLSGCSGSGPDQGAAPQSSSALTGQVVIAGKPVADATVTLYAAGDEAPAQVAQGKSAADGKFTVDAKSAPKDAVLYLIAKSPTKPSRSCRCSGPRYQRASRSMS